MLLCHFQEKSRNQIFSHRNHVLPFVVSVCLFCCMVFCHKQNIMQQIRDSLESCWEPLLLMFLKHLGSLEDCFLLYLLKFMSKKYLASCHWWCHSLLEEVGPSVSHVSTVMKLRTASGIASAFSPQSSDPDS